MTRSARVFVNSACALAADTWVVIRYEWSTAGAERRRTFLLALAALAVLVAGLRWRNSDPAPLASAPATMVGACTDETPLEHGCARVGDLLCLRSPPTDTHPSVVYALRPAGLVLRPAPGAKTVTIRLPSGQTSSAFSAFVALEAQAPRVPVLVEGPAALCLSAVVGA